MATDAQRRRPATSLLVVRYVLPAVIVIAGIVAAATDSGHAAAEGAGGIIGAGIAIWALNWFFRLGVRGDVDRAVEAAARDYYSVNGVWPDDEACADFAHDGRWPDRLTAGDAPAA